MADILNVNEFITNYKNLTSKEVMAFLDEHIPRYRKISIRALDELEETFESYCAMAGALVGESEATLGAETYHDAMEQKEKYEIEMLNAIRKIIDKEGIESEYI